MTDNKQTRHRSHDRFEWVECPCGEPETCIRGGKVLACVDCGKRI